MSFSPWTKFIHSQSMPAAGLLSYLRVFIFIVHFYIFIHIHFVKLSSRRINIITAILLLIFILISYRSYRALDNNTQCCVYGKHKLFHETSFRKYISLTTSMFMFSHLCDKWTMAFVWSSAGDNFIFNNCPLVFCIYVCLCILCICCVSKYINIDWI
jgi:hypothetical protein